VRVTTPAALVKNDEQVAQAPILAVFSPARAIPGEMGSAEVEMPFFLVHWPWER